MHYVELRNPNPSAYANGQATFIRELRVDRPFMLKPVVVKTYTRQGTRYYRTTEGKTYLADVFDNIFNCAVKKKKIKNKQYRDKIIDGRANWIEDEE